MRGARPLNREEVTQILSELEQTDNTREAAWIALSAYQGWRIGEVLSLTLGDVWQAGQLVSEVYIYQSKTKAGRRVPLHQTAAHHLKRHVDACLAAGYKESDPLFASRKRVAGERQAITRQHANASLETICRSCGITGKVSSHSLRKHYCMACYKALDKDPVSTMRATGHKSLQTLTHYLQACSDTEVEQAILNL